VHHAADMQVQKSLRSAEKRLKIGEEYEKDAIYDAYRLGLDFPKTTNFGYGVK
jgi:hypothetical protein